MLVQDFLMGFVEKKIENTKINEHAVSDYLKQTLEIRTYIPFREKRMVAEMVATQNLIEVDGIKKYDNIGGYIGLIVASIAAHTNIEWSSDPVSDYDLLAESGLLPQIIAEFQGSHEEIGILLKMVLAMELEDNNVNVLIGHFLDDILKKLGSVGEKFKGVLGDFNIQDILSGNIKEEDLTKLSGLIDKLK